MTIHFGQLLPPAVGFAHNNNGATITATF